MSKCPHDYASKLPFDWIEHAYHRHPTGYFYPPPGEINMMFAMLCELNTRLTALEEQSNSDEVTTQVHAMANTLANTSSALANILTAANMVHK